MSLFDFCPEGSSSQRSGSSADSPNSLASSPASSANSCDTLLVCGTEKLEANSGLDSGSGVITPNSTSSHVPGGTATIPPADNWDRIRALMAKYERVMSGDGAQTPRVSSHTLNSEGGHSAILPGSRDHDDGIDEKPTRKGAMQGSHTSRGSRRDKKVHSRAQSRLQKKGASVSRRQAYTFELLGGARRAASGAIEYEVYWEATWLPIEHLQGNDAFQEARDLGFDLFGLDTWHEEARKLGL